jgi:hypothetical protein
VVVYLAGLSSALFLYYLLLDSIVFNVAKFHIDSFWLEWVANDLEGFGLPGMSIVYASAALLVLIIVQIGIFRLAKRLQGIRYLGLAFWSVVILAFAISQTIHAAAHERNDSRITKLSPYFPMYVPITSHSNAQRYGDLLPIGESTWTSNSVGNQVGSMNYPLSPMKYIAPAGEKFPNVVIIMLEGWRADMMNSAVTPHIFDLSQRSSTFLNHFSTGNQTTCGVFGIFYGLHATYWSSVKANNAMIDNPVLIDCFREHHYDFGVFAKSNFKRHKIKDAVFRGIDVRESFAGASILEQDADMTEQIIAFMEEKSADHNPFMLFAFYKSNHLPYRYPESHAVFQPAKDLQPAFVNSDTDPESYLNDNRNANHYVDSLVGEVIRAQEALGLAENTVIIVTSDHGESFNDNGANYWSHGTNFTQFQTKVPMIVYWPGRGREEISRATSHMDLSPTLLQDIFGCTTDIRDYTTGRNLFTGDSTLRPFVLGSYVNHAFIFGDDVFEIYPIYTKRYKLFDINQEASVLSRDVIKTIAEEISRFSGRNGSRPLVSDREIVIH